MSAKCLAPPQIASMVSSWSRHPYPTGGADPTAADRHGMRVTVAGPAPAPPPVPPPAAAAVASGASVSQSAIVRLPMMLTLPVVSRTAVYRSPQASETAPTAEVPRETSVNGRGVVMLPAPRTPVAG